MSPADDLPPVASVGRARQIFEAEGPGGAQPQQPVAWPSVTQTARSFSGSSRVIRKGRRPALGCSYHHKSPLATTNRGPRRAPRRQGAGGAHRSTPRLVGPGRSSRQASRAGRARSRRRWPGRPGNPGLGQVGERRLSDQRRVRHLTMGCLPIQEVDELVRELNLIRAPVT